ncbi:MAG: SH3 domain-containing protein, partial [Rhodobacteraceae bacterium]
MNKYILLSFAFMGVAFYEMSGGAHFVPRKAEIIAAGRAAEAAAEAER